jgi:hypothetical protein
VVLADSRRLSRIRRYSGAPTGVQTDFVYGAVTLCGPPFQNGSTICCICNSVEDLVLLLPVPTTPRWQRHQAFHHLGLGSSRFARRYSGSRCCFPFLGLLRCFSSPGSLYPPYVFRREYHPITGGGFPHSVIRGSTLSRQLPAAYRSLSRPSSVVSAKASTVGSS